MSSERDLIWRKHTRPLASIQLDEGAVFKVGEMTGEDPEGFRVEGGFSPQIVEQEVVQSPIKGVSSLMVLGMIAQMERAHVRPVKSFMLTTYDEQYLVTINCTSGLPEYWQLVDTKKPG